MKILGLTGSIGMGKSTAAKTFRALGIPVFDADKAVHKMTGSGGAALGAVEKRFPGVVGKGGVDRAKLGAIVFHDKRAKADLEAILHPMVADARARWLARQRRRREPLVVFDIPLLFETGGEDYCDYTAVVSAPARLQKERVLRRPNMSEAKFNAIKASQMPDVEKRRRADFIIKSGLDLRTSRADIIAIIKKLRGS